MGCDWCEETLKDARETQKTNIKLNMQIIAQQETIQRMAEYIAKQDIDEDICKPNQDKDICKLGIYDTCTETMAMECIIQYFSEVE